MIKFLFLLFMPTIFVFFGLWLIQNVLVTFVCFYGWMFMILYANNKINLKVALTKKSLYVGTLSGVLCAAAIIGSSLLFSGKIFHVEDMQAVLQIWGFSGWKVIILAVVLIFINPVLEEVYWRVYIQNKVKKHVSVLASSIVTSSFYTFYHVFIILPVFVFPFNMISVIGVFSAGMMWAYIRERYGIKGAIISHALADAAIMIVYGLYVR
ncbi:CPBP family intramembrane metalloprotease [Priestia aryabhattai]|uniref:CPBP family intramembrane glutamic endopeptidase n=1 Tax=Priestia aryabhattai TaxID=412384 RepID=UPI000B504BEC|nr:CPBP family intramembrane glutamic endopeptidase [Priestia aryabhattai]MBZ6486688.1 CPBP family intramembrane metalloprotease [Priestia aryabhattai]MDH3132205.1 CPBP family intramembrane metalloprotease [Priestia aryabhattai]OVE36792.1 CPBP family intramembrane metalloprotease [Priestia aryabhattai]